MVYLLLAYIAADIAASGGRGGALRVLRSHWFGRPLPGLVAAGLLAFSLSSFFEAVYREA